MKEKTSIPKRFGAAGHTYDLDEDAWLTREGLEGTDQATRSAWEAYGPAWKADLEERLASATLVEKPLVDWEAELPLDLSDALNWLREARAKFEAITYNSDPKKPLDAVDYDRLMRWRRWATDREAFATGRDPYALTVPRFGPSLEHVFWMVVRDRVSPERLAHWLFTTPEHVVGAVRYGLARMARTLKNVSRHSKLHEQPSSKQAA